MDTAGSNSESYLAAARVNALFARVDVNWGDQLRIVAGARFEDYQQVSLIWNPLAYDGSQISSDPQVLADSVFTEDNLFWSLSATWMVQDFWAADFQLRFGFAETTVRPDLREIIDTTYIDPLTGAITSGNPEVVLQ